MYTDNTALLIAKIEVQELNIVASYYVIKSGKTSLQNKWPGVNWKKPDI